MKITKLTHACLIIEEDQKQLLIDPGVFTKDIPELENLSGIVITHVHPDHINDIWIKELQETQPSVPIYTIQQVADAFPDIKFEVIDQEQAISVDSFSIDFWPNDHAIIHPNLPRFKNLSVMVNNDLFYPGDSFYVPNKPVQTLACPASAPWLKISEVIDYIQAIKANRVFPTHDAILSEVGNGIHHRLMKSACENAHSDWIYAIPGEQIEDIAS